MWLWLACCHFTEMTEIAVVFRSHMCFLPKVFLLVTWFPSLVPLFLSVSTAELLLEESNTSHIYIAAEELPMLLVSLTWGEVNSPLAVHEEEV